jgi:hypothetical protein
VQLPGRGDFRATHAARSLSKLFARSDRAVMTLGQLPTDVNVPREHVPREHLPRRDVPGEMSPGEMSPGEIWIPAFAGMTKGAACAGMTSCAAFSEMTEVSLAQS